MATKLIVGLGNPGAKYERTRHNVGWMVLDEFARKYKVTVDRTAHHGVYGELRSWGPTGDKVFLLKPLTFMNLSGRSLAPFANFYKVAPADVLVIYDDLDLPPGKLRLREKGSAGGHNGMKSIIQEFGTQDFPRLRVGIGRPAPGWEVVDWVLAPFGGDDAITIAQVMPRAVEAVEAFLTEGTLKAMTKYNG
ncbi:MAG TPA: aminoacyl-tRNA hydrolase [Symbiobacteriaceae bacterium]|jgi:PTH1 family peptidyl-tRNA hydrolase|nr:aminoacyl-tRNA hydrolase [Symbiobacteriaceae bacterium]